MDGDGFRQSIEQYDTVRVVATHVVVQVGSLIELALGLDSTGNLGAKQHQCHWYCIEAFVISMRERFGIGADCAQIR